MKESRILAQLKARSAVELCSYRAQQAAQQAEQAERAEREALMVQTLHYQWAGLLTPQEAARLRREGRWNS